MPIRFSIRTCLLAVFVVSLSLAVAVYRADRQRQAVNAIENQNGSVAYDDGCALLSSDYVSHARRNRMIQDLTRTVTGARIELSGYTIDTKIAFSKLDSLKRIYIVGANSERAKNLIENDFPDLDVVDLPSLLIECCH
jgi:hypothetical protein